MHFIKMHGIGNDYIYVDEFLYKAPADIGDAARLASDRHTGIGGDGLILIQPSQIADCKMRMCRRQRRADVRQRDPLHRAVYAGTPSGNLSWRYGAD